jgi:hypothetical protein
MTSGSQTLAGATTTLNYMADIAARERRGRGFDAAGATAKNVTPTSDLLRHTTRQ